MLAPILLLALKSVIPIPGLYAERRVISPPWSIREILVLTCTLVSFFHGSNDGQKAVGLIMSILIGTVPTAYAPHRARSDSQLERFQKTSNAASEIIWQKAMGYSVLGNPRPAVMAFVSQRKINEGTYPSLAVLVRDIADQVAYMAQLPRCQPKLSATRAATCTLCPNPFAW